MIKAVFFDVDGTLVSLKTKVMPESTKRALTLLKEKGVKIIIATGRHIIDLDKLPDFDFIYDTYLTLNGQLILDKNLNVIEGHPIKPEELEVISKIFEAKKLPIKLITENSKYINYVDNVVVNTQLDSNGSIPEIGEYHGEPIYQMNAYVDSHKQEILEELLDYCDITSWHETGIDIYGKGGGKNVGAKICLEKIGIDPSEAMAFGDGNNDIAMMQYVGISVAMGNANDAVKSIADYITDDCDDDGIFNALKHFGVI